MLNDHLKLARKTITFFAAISFIFSFFVISYAIFWPLGDSASLSDFMRESVRFAGLLCFFMLSSLIFIGDTSRFLDRYYGLDRIISFNKKYATAAAILIISHPLLLIFSTGKIRDFIVPDFAILPLAMGILSLYVFCIMMAASAVHKRIHYGLWQYIHMLNYALFAMVVYHALNTGSDTGRLPIRIMIWFFILIIPLGAVYRFSYKIRQRKNKFKVAWLKWETKDTFTVALESSNKMGFKPGQFCFLRLKSLYTRHPFTISSAPSSRYLEFTIKLQGRFTKAVSALKKGDGVFVEGPFGAFIMDDSAKKHVFISGGVGITPFMSMIRAMRGGKKKKDIVLVYGSKNYKDIIFRKELDSMKKLKKLYVLSDEDKDYGVCRKGYVDEKIIKGHVDDISGCVFYICGPEPMKRCVKEALSNMGVERRDIKIEDFFW